MLVRASGARNGQSRRGDEADDYGGRVPLKVCVVVHVAR
jgi:hypothetical protein